MVIVRNRTEQDLFVGTIGGATWKTAYSNEYSNGRQIAMNANELS